MPPASNRFRYETLLRLRKRQEELRAQELAITQRAARRAGEEREQIAAEQRRALEQAAQLMDSPSLNARDLRRHYQYERFLARMDDAKEAEILAFEETARHQREALKTAMKHKRIIERLKEKHLLARFAELRKQEQRETDEAASIRAVLRNPAAERRIPNKEDATS